MQAVTWRIRVMPGGGVTITVMLFFFRLYRAPGSTAWTLAIISEKLPGRVTSSVVTKRRGSSPPLCTTVPWGIRMLYPAGAGRPKETTPTALSPALRVRPRRAAWRSRASPSAVRGKAFCTAASAVLQCSASWSASTRIRIITSEAWSGVHLVWLQ